MTAFALIALCVGGLLAGFLLLRHIPIVPPSIPTETTLPAVSVIIPARNEESNLPALLTSVMHSQLRPAEVIVVDDGSTDNTGAVASEFGAKVVTLTSIPTGWRGKNWACHQGALAATSETFLFLDADARFAPSGFERTLSFFHTLPPQSALSLLPFHATREPYEEVSLFFNLLMAAGAGGFGKLDRSHLFGQSLVIQRDLYLRAGGHASVRQHVLENFHFASHIRAANGDIYTASGRGTLFIRMFPHGIAQLCESWEKGFADGAADTSSLVLFFSIYWLSAAATVFVTLILGVAIPRTTALLLYLAFAFELAWQSKQIGSFRLLTAIFYPAPLLFYFIIFGRSAWRKHFRRSVTWKGRQL
jgi:4,4'-diaponeurosporenoate glycosyltransferase